MESIEVVAAVIRRNGSLLVGVRALVVVTAAYGTFELAMEAMSSTICSRTSSIGPAAHVREACWLASLRRLEHGEEYELALGASIATLRAQSQRAESYRFDRERRAIGIR